LSLSLIQVPSPPPTFLLLDLMCFQKNTEPGSHASVYREELQSVHTWGKNAISKVSCEMLKLESMKGVGF
jgi:hypothetical protein